MPKGKFHPFLITQLFFSGIVTAALVLSGLHGLWRELWVEWLLIPVALLACSIGIFEFLTFHRKWGKLHSALVAVILFLLSGIVIFFGYKVSSPTQSPEFSIQTTWIQNEAGCMRYIDYDNDEQIVPFNGAVLVEFTNLKPVPIMIYSYTVEKKAPDGKWIRSDLIPEFGINRGHVLVGYDAYTNLTEWDYTSFDSEIQDRNIAPNQTVRGWLFFKTYFNGWNLRFRLKDTLGNLSTESFQAGSGLDNGWPSQDLLLKRTTNYVDFRSLLPLPEK